MRRFTQLYTEIDRTTSTNAKLEALRAYFTWAPPEDAAWALWLLSGRRLKRAISRTVLHDCVCDVTGLPDWIVSRCYEEVGDMSETLALLLPEAGRATDEPFHCVVERWLLPLPALDDVQRMQLLKEAWSHLGSTERFVFHKLISGTYRVGVARTLVVRAFAAAAGVPAGVMEHRLLAAWKPTAEDYARLLSPTENARDPTQPYPFYLAYPLEMRPAELGPIDEWHAEWKWDGLRAQLIRRKSRAVLWSRGEELLAASFPEIRDLANALPDGTVVDGEIVAWEHGRALPFVALQRRIGRKLQGPMLWDEVPVVFMAFDLLERGGTDWRESPFVERRSELKALIAAAQQDRLMLSPAVNAADWEQLGALRRESRERGVEGLMLKRRGSTYGVGRTKGDWWKWKIDPYTVDAVLIYAQQGSGRRAGLFTDYTFGVWDDRNGRRELVPIAKAYSGLTDAEIREVDSFIRKNTLDRRGPVRLVKPELVFELAFEGVQPSTRHKVGLAVRFPRMARWRQDKSPAEADSIETLRALLASRESGIRSG